MLLLFSVCKASWHSLAQIEILRKLARPKMRGYTFLRVGLEQRRALQNF